MQRTPEDPSIPNDFSALGIWCAWLYWKASLGQKAVSKNVIPFGAAAGLLF
jgi:hypothetical protein